MRPMIRGALALTLAGISLTAMAAPATLTRAWQFKAHPSASLDVQNFDGDVRVVAGSEAGFHVTATVRVEGRSAAEAEQIAKAIEFRTRDVGPDSRFHVNFPKEAFPRLYHDDAPRYWWGGVMYTKYLGERRRMTGDEDEAAPIKVELLIKAPAGSRLEIRNRLGSSTATGFEGSLLLDTGRGDVRSENGKGRLDLDTGSGDAEVAIHEGPVRADTGSGRVSITDCRCEITADAGSGEVRIQGGAGVLRADTGSGAVSIRGFRGPIHADTGSGGLRAEDVSELRELDVDTGSGSVSVEGDLSALNRLRVDTGSGRVQIRSSAMANMFVTIDTGSGRIDVDAPDAETRRLEDGTMTVRLGAGEGRGIIDTGSGSVELRFASLAAQPSAGE